MRQLTLPISVVLTAAFCCTAIAQEAENLPLKTGNDFRKTLASSTKITWQEVPLRSGLDHVASAHSVAIFLDRRVDPDQKVDFRSADEPLEIVLTRITEKLGLGICFEADVVYIGPTSITEKIPTLLAVQQQRIEAFDADLRKRFQKPNSLTWEMLAEPKALVAEIAGRCMLKTIDLDSVTHDLWPAGQLPSAALSEQLTFVLAGFDLTFNIDKDGTNLTIIPIPEDAIFKCVYSIKREQAKLIAALQKKYPKAAFENVSGKVAVTASFAEHAAIRRGLFPPRETPAPMPGGKEVLSLNVTAPAGSVLKTLALHMDCELKYDPSLRNKLTEIVKINAREVSVEELLKQTLDPLGLAYKTDGKTLTIIEEE